MKVAFIIALIVFVLAHVYIIYHLYKNKKKVGSHATLKNFVFFTGILIAIYIVRIDVPDYIILLCMLSLFLNSYFGYYHAYFWRSKTFDRVLHGIGTFTFALLFFFIIVGLTEPGGTKLFQALFVAFLGVTIGALFEISEYLTDLRRATRMQKGLVDTDVDIIANIVGACTAGLFAYFVILH